MEKKNKKIAIVGARGIANYGGFESFVREIATRFSIEGYDVYCSSEKTGNLSDKYQDVNLVYFPIRMPENYGIKRKILHLTYKIYFSIYFSLFKKCDVIYFLGAAQSIFTIIPRLFGKSCMVNMGGVEWKRSKFNKFEKFLIRINFKLSVICSNYVIIDNNGLKNYISEKYRKKLVYIPYGASIDLKNSEWDKNIADQYFKNDFKADPNDYWLMVTRISPDNNVHTVIDAFIKSDSKKPLIVIGSLSSSTSYCNEISKILKNNKDKKIIFMGGIYNQDHLNMFRSNCFGYIHAHSIGGTNPSLLEAMFLKNIIIAHENEFNKEVCGDSALFYNNIEDLIFKIEMLEKNYHNFAPCKYKAFERVLKYYNWEQVVNDYLKIFNYKFNRKK